MHTPRTLLETFEELIGGWRKAFSQQRVYGRARRLTFGLLTCLRLHLTSNAICATGRQFVDWAADYRLFSRSPWEPVELFDVVLDQVPGLLDSASAPLMLALDDTQLPKTSRKIDGVSLGRDPMSPPFRVNLRYGLRFVQASVLLPPPGGNGAARAIPVRFEMAPPAIKPKAVKEAEKLRKQEKASAQNKPGQPQPAKRRKSQLTPEEVAYREEKKKRALPQVGLNLLHSVRASMDERPELRERVLLALGDNSYTNRRMLQGLPERTTYIGRIREDARLCWPPEPSRGKRRGRPRRYGPKAPTPGEILRDESIPWTTVRCFAAGRFHEMQVKVLRNLYWRNAGADMPVQVVVIQPLGYRLRKGARLSYRRPAFLICDDPALGLQLLVQAYIYRWEIECNHRDEKSLLGVGQGQVQNPNAVRRLPQFQVAGYSLLLLASLLSSGFRRTGQEYLPLPKWRVASEQARPSLLDLLNLMRHQIFARGADAPLLDFEAFLSTAPEAVKATKLPLAAETLGTLAA